MDRARVVRMPGSSIAGPTAVGWVTDFLNAAYFARPADQRSLDDLRLAFCILTTRWQQRGADTRLAAGDVLAFHRAFGPHRLRAVPRMTLDRGGLLDGGATLFGDWFGAAVGDPARRAHGIAFATVADREAFDPSSRLAFTALGELDPPRRPPGEQVWSDYAAVPLASAERAAALMEQPERWPGRRGRGRALHRAAPRRPGRPDLRDRDRRDPGAARARLHPRLRHRHARPAPRRRRPRRVRRRADGRRRRTGGPRRRRRPPRVELTTHVGHFLGRGLSRLLVWEDDQGAWLRDVGSWDPLPAELAAPYRFAGEAAQHAFWGPDKPDQSMLVQIALASA
jgi:hypothetical protein